MSSRKRASFGVSLDPSAGSGRAALRPTGDDHHAFDGVMPFDRNDTDALLASGQFGEDVAFAGMMPSRVSGSPEPGRR